METKISDIMQKEAAQQQGPGPVPVPLPNQQQGVPLPVNTSPKDVKENSKFAQMPQQQGTVPGPESPKVLPNLQGTVGQGYSNPQKEFFGVSDIDFKSTAIVFGLVLIFSSSLFFDCVKGVIPSVMSDGKVTVFGSVFAALISSIIYIIIKYIMTMV